MSVFSGDREVRRTDSENIRNHRMPRQFYINTGHVRQRQSLFNPCDVQVEPLYGINEAVYDPQELKAQDLLKIQVPPIFNINPRDCGLQQGLGLCVPQCYPGCPPDNKGMPLTPAYFQTHCCQQEEVEKTAGSRYHDKVSSARAKSLRKAQSTASGVGVAESEYEYTENNNLKSANLPPPPRSPYGSTHVIRSHRQPIRQ